MHKYEEQKFDLPTLDGISDKQIEVHLGLYAGYVKHVEILHQQITELREADAEKYAFAIESIRRRLAFEFNGMRMHEFYFPQFEGGATERTEGGDLEKALSEKYGSWDGFIDHFKKVGMSRGSGWCSLVWDKKNNMPFVYWTTDHELGTMADVKVMLAMDMWEHAYMVDYLPAEKAKHVDAFLKNINWSVVEERFNQAAR